MTFPNDVDIQKLSTAFVTGALQNEQSYIDGIDAQIEALQAQRTQHETAREICYAELVARGQEPYRVYLVKLDIGLSEAKLNMTVPSSVIAQGFEATGNYLEHEAGKLYPHDMPRVRTFYDANDPRKTPDPQQPEPVLLRDKFAIGQRVRHNNHGTTGVVKTIHNNGWLTVMPDVPLPLPALWLQALTTIIDDQA